MSNKAPQSQNKSLFELEAGECRWPLGDPRQPGFHFCGAKQALGRPYRIQHWALSFVPGKGRHGSPAPALKAEPVPALTSDVTPTARPPVRRAD